MYVRVTGTLFGARYYFLTFTDDASRYACVQLLITEDEAYDKFRAFKTEVENIHKPKIIPLLP